MTVYEVLWVLSNVIHDSISSAEYVCNNDLFIDKLISNYKNAIKFQELRDISYLFNILVKLVNVNGFIKLANKGLIDITLQIAEKTFDDPKKITVVFELIESYLDIGNNIKVNFGKDDFVRQKCDDYGLINLLQKYENTSDESLGDVVDRILRNHYN